MSDDDQSPMMWPTRAPYGKLPSRGSTPLLGPGGVAGGAGLSGPTAMIAATMPSPAEMAAAQPGSPFMLPQAHAGMSAPPLMPEHASVTMGWPGAANGGYFASAGYAASAGMWGIPVGVYPQQPQLGAYGQLSAQQPQMRQGRPALQHHMPQHQFQQQYPHGVQHRALDCGSIGLAVSSAGASAMQQPSAMTAPSVAIPQGISSTALQQALAEGGAAGMRGKFALSGWTAIWVGERAFRASASMKEQMEAVGFLVKIYRSHDRCSKALDKKASIPPTNAFVLSVADAEPMLAYLNGRGSTNLRIVVDVEGVPAADAQELASRLVCPEGSVLTIAGSWDEVLAVLRVVHEEVAAPPQVADLPAPTSNPASAQLPAPQASQASPVSLSGNAADPPSPSMDAGVTPSAGAPWTLVWISDQAFKPAAASMKQQLEMLGCQVKGYKTQRNAARALDKKRTLVRTMVLVSGAEAPAFLAYLASRPELAATQVIVEASARTAPVRESPTCKVVEGFEDAVQALQTLVASAGVD